MKEQELKDFFRKQNKYRFSPARCKAVGLSVIDAKFLRALLLSERDNAWVIQNFGGCRAYRLLKHGLVTNPLAVFGDAHTNVWRLTREGSEVLTSMIDR